ncbi:NlpC/P60 family protein [Streptomyces sp. DSM 44917]|uniref:NlpC/P60 family protein n=1 Tax=Streptomyces boetiae TaxID=3075541 RepID=A0ABU2LE39_9ACTN|nr:NlpC/P60 family protein [Streptomyces sp. DSM 44917]MDT0309826.1 NlpC/P60 family protein [Streptomyces sp. DSM 44917]
MASHRRPKQPSRARVTLFGATAVATAATSFLASQSAQADPERSVEEVREEVDELRHEAEVVTEEYNGAREREQELQDQVEDLQDSVDRGQQELNELRAGLGAVATAQYRNGGLDPSLQLFLSADPDAYLDRASTLDQVSGEQAETLRLIEDRQRTLDQQRAEATDRLAELEDLRGELEEQKDRIRGRLSEAQELLNQLTEEQRAAIAAEEAAERATSQAQAAEVQPADIADAGGSSRAQAILTAAASRLGMPYVWGATGPNAFDCSGFTGWSYAQAGISLPRVSQAQAGAGTRVSIDQLAPGDLVLYYGGLSHIAIYAGNGQIIHAPSTGSVVSYAPLHSMPAQFGVRVG